MGKPHLKTLATTMLLGAALAACGSTSPSPDSSNDTKPSYIPSADAHPCLGVSVIAPDVIKLESEAAARVEVSNRCDEATTYESSGPPYSLALVRDDEVFWYTPSEPVPSILLEYTVEANGTTFYDVPVPLSNDNVPPGNYRMIANLFIHQVDPDATQYEEPLRLESEAKNVNVEP